MSEESKQYFHFTLGPVQGFVAQARRTRDFWAGSFILSWLAAVAMEATRRQSGEDAILFPLADKNYLQWLTTGKGAGEKPRQGGVPNRFKAAVPENFDPEQVTESVQAAWKGLADNVFKADLQDYEGTAAKEIWERQIPAFWDMAWAMTPDANDSAVLDRRKNWRSYRAPDEPGVKCMMMDGWQELSNAPSPGEELKDFWKKLRAQKGKTALQTDLRENEALCAVAFVKRRFVHYFKSLKVPMPGGWSAHGWELESGVPSVSYLAAAHWLERAVKLSHQDRTLYDALWQFHDAAFALTKEYNAWETKIRCVIDAKPHKKWQALDGQVFFRSTLENPKVYDQNQAKEVADALARLDKLLEIEPVSPFYAVLLMDGDSLGEHMSDPEKQNTISTALKKFTSQVPEIVDKKSGFLIYAGGDDVLAVLPLEDALDCARELRACYLDCFKSTPVESTLSGAIEYAHIKMPLTKVLRDAHDLLDNIAKDQTGRDAIAVRVWKPGGLALEWAQPWEIALQDGKANGELVLNRQVKNFQKPSKEDGKGGFSSKFFYKIRERFDLLNPQPGQDKVLDFDQAVTLMAMEYLNSGEAAVKTMEAAEEFIRPLLEQCRPVYRKKDRRRKNWEEDSRLHADAALLVRFLAHKGSADMIAWHRIFGLVLEDLFTGTGYDVEVEKDLSRKAQLLDIVIIHREPDSRPPTVLPDGLENLATHNLLTYKSLHEAMDAWALDELTGHYVNYRKSLAAQDSKKLPPDTAFRLYAVATRYPEKLAAQVAFEPVSAGVYEIQWGARKIRLIVPSQVPDTDANAVWAMFSADGGRVFAGEQRYIWRDPDKRIMITSTLREAYHQEGVDMAYTKEDFLRDWLQTLPAEVRLKGLPAEVRLKGLPAEVRLKGLPAEVRLKGLPPEERLKGLSLAEVLKALPVEEVKAWLAEHDKDTKH